MAKTITLPYPPSVNNLYASVRGRKVLSKQGRAYKATSAAMALAAGCRVVEGPVVVHVDFYRPAKRGDLDNTLKAMLDSLTGVAWNDDAQVVEIHARRFEDKGNPRAEVRILAA